VMAVAREERLRPVRIALLGYGTVNQSFVRLVSKKLAMLANGHRLGPQLVAVLRSEEAIVAPAGLSLDWEQVSALQTEQLRDVPNGIPLPNASQEDVLSEKRPDLVVQAIPSDVEAEGPARSQVLTSLRVGAHAITATKSALVHAFGELRDAASKSNRVLRYSAATSAALPTVDVAETALRGADIIKVQGILNGTSNYVLSRMEETGCSMAEALGEARELGIAESDPRLDIEGYDTASKLTIITNSILERSGGNFVDIDNVKIEGITKISRHDVSRSRTEGLVTRLVGTANMWEDPPLLSVAPENLATDHPLSRVTGKDKGILFDTDTMGRIAVVGGASSPLGAAAAMLRDLINIYAS
jgi:homoserine dehydrogenase